ncbi:MAG: hypothetical protein ACE5EQ_02200 [Phycisphaerae bacterium]
MNTEQPGQTPADPLIDEVRAIRRALSDQFENDVDRLCDYLQELERRHPEQLVKPTTRSEEQSQPDRHS